MQARAMFGEYGVYCEEKFIALICDDTLFIKPTAVSSEYFTDADLAPPYPGARNHYVVSGDRLEDRDWLQEVFTRTTELVPRPKPKTRKTRAPTAEFG
jgi:TfoX/Sxy family transcriptional regulator of competence genes